MKAIGASCSLAAIPYAHPTAGSRISTRAVAIASAALLLFAIREQNQDRGAGYRDAARDAVLA